MMDPEHTLFTWIGPRVAAGSAAMARHLAAHARATGREAALAVDPGDARAFLEPMLYAWAVTGADPRHLDWILYGYRPAGTAPRTVLAPTNRLGMAHLPGIGWVATDIPDGSVELANEGDGRFFWSDQGVRRSSSIDPGRRCWPDAVVDGHGHPFTRVLFPDADGLDSGCGDLPDQVAGAAALITATAPTMARLLSAVLRRVNLFESPCLGSFAAMSCHGVVFLNARLVANAIGFVEELAHQAGHVLLSTCLDDASSVFDGDPQAIVAGEGSEQERSWHTLLHGVFTEWTIMHCLEAVLLRGRLDALQAHEAVGRLAYIGVKAAADVGQLVSAPLSDGGVALVRELALATGRIAERWRPQLAVCDLEGQPYTFDPELFFRRNPARPLAAAVGGR